MLTRAIVEDTFAIVARSRYEIPYIEALQLVASLGGRLARPCGASSCALPRVYRNGAPFGGVDIEDSVVRSKHAQTTKE